MKLIYSILFSILLVYSDLFSNNTYIYIILVIALLNIVEILLKGMPVLHFSRTEIIYIFFIIIIYIYIVLNYSFTNQTELSKAKFTGFHLKIFFPVILGYINIKLKNFNLLSIFYITPILSIILILPNRQYDIYSRLFIVDNDYISSGRILGINIICILYLLLNNKKVKLINIFLLFYIMLFGYFLLMNGSRQVIISISFLIIVIVGNLLFRKVTLSKMTLIAGTFILLLIISPIFINLIENTYFYDRIVTSGIQSNSRLILYKESWEIIGNHFFTGVGLGNYFYFTSTGYLYPHNLLIEILLETGIIGIIFLISFLIIPAILKVNHFLKLLYLFWFLCSLFSFNLNGNSSLLIFSFLLTISYFQNRNKEENVKKIDINKQF